MLENELRVLKEYINNKLAQGYIRLSMSLINTSIMFVLKKYRKLRLCINYCKLNVITVKDKYLLPLANKLRDKLYKAK